MNFTYDVYKKILNNLKENNYDFSFFEDESKGKKVYLRHDIDLDIIGALNMAKIEHNMGINSTWFIMPNNRLYNIMNRDIIKILKEITDMGHQLGLHIDASSYNSVKDLKNDLNKYYEFYKDKINLSKTFSFHIPNKELFQNDIKIDGFTNAYDSKFFKEITYISDSNRREFLNEDRFPSALKNNKSMQLLIHPIWWNEKNILKEEIRDYLTKYLYDDLVDTSCKECLF